MISPTLSIVVPARNEKNYIELIILRFLDVHLPQNTEILFIEGHSTDGTLNEIERVAESYKNKINIRYAVQDGIGKANAVWCGFELAQNDILMIWDADLTVSPEDLPKFYETVVKKSAVLINGSRIVYPIEKGAMRPLNYLGNKFFALLLSLITGQKLSDTLCGTKAIYKRQFKEIQKSGLLKKLNDPFGDFSLLLGASFLGLEIIEIPIGYKRRIYGSTKIRRFREGWKLLKIAVQYMFLSKHGANQI